MRKLILEDFSGRIGETFALIEDGVEDYRLTLKASDPLPQRGDPEGMRPPFSLIFAGADQIMLPQKLYRLAHQRLGDIEIFLVPVSRDAGEFRYEAVFN